MLAILVTILTLAALAGAIVGWYFLRPTYTWTISDEGVLTISGITVIDLESKELRVTGSVPSFTGAAPWEKRDASITAVAVDETLISMSASALSGLTNLTSIDLPKSLGWEGIETVPIPEKEGFVGQWVEVTNGTRSTFTVNYREVFTITFVADGDVVAAVDYLDGDLAIEEPEIPEKDGWTAAWESYTLTGDATVSAVYSYGIWTGVTSEKVYFYADAGAESNPVGTLSAGLTVAVLDEAMVDDTIWYRMSEGWISGKYLTDATYIGSSLADDIGIITDQDFIMSDETAAGILTGIQLLTVRGFDVGFMLTDLTTGKTIRYNADEAFYSASTIKAPYVVSVINRSPDAATSFYYTIQEIVVNSSNDDYHKLRSTYGKTSMVDWCEAAGVDTDIANVYYPAITAEQLCKLWMQNYTYFTTAEGGQTVASWFEKPYKSPIHSVLGSKFTTQTKAGWIEGTTDYYQAASDAGIVYADSGAYAVAILSNGRSNLTLLNTLVEALDTAHSEMG